MTDFDGLITIPENNIARSDKSRKNLALCCGKILRCSGVVIKGQFSCECRLNLVNTDISTVD